MSIIVCFTIVVFIMTIGDFASARTKAFVPSVFVAALIFVLGFWNGWIPKDIMNQAGLANPIVTVAMYLVIVHMGSLMSVREMIAEWKTIVIALAGLVGMVALLRFSRSPSYHSR